MDTITLGQIATAAAFLVALIASGTALIARMKKWILAAVKEEINRLDKKIDEQGKKLDEMELKRDRTRADSARRNILNYNDELLRHISHSKESFDQCLRDIDAYEHYCGSVDPDYQNNQALFAIQNIKRCYAKCIEESSFLS